MDRKWKMNGVVNDLAGENLSHTVKLETTPYQSSCTSVLPDG